MARELYTNIAARAETDGTLKALSNVRVTVNLAGTATPATIYRDKSSGSQGPLVSSGASGTNPFVTGASGLIGFWAEVQELDVILHDIVVPARIADVTYGWSPLSAAVGGIPGNRIGADGGIPLGAFSAAALRQDVPIGGVIEWFRPSTGYDAGAGVGNGPPGYEICDGRSIAQVNHDWGAIGSVALPDLRNKFILGADASKANGAAATGGNGATEGPGIGGAGGSHFVALTTAQLAVHSHTPSGNIYQPRAGGTLVNNANDYFPIPGYTAVDGWSDTPASSTMGTANAGSGEAHSNMPLWVGLLKIMKVKRS